MLDTESTQTARTRLLASGKTLFARLGYEQTSTAAIAREAFTSESQLVRHFSEAGDDGSTVTYAARAGDAAARLYANAEAEAHYRTGLDAARRIAARASNASSAPPAPPAPCASATSHPATAGACTRRRWSAGGKD